MIPTQVLIIGNEVSDFFNPVAHRLNQTGRFEIDLLEIRGGAENNQQTTKSYRNIIDTNFLKLKHRPIHHLLNFSPVALMQALSAGQKIKSSLRSSMLQKQMVRLCDQYDVVNYQFLSNACLELERISGAGAQKILSFWGTDLFTASEHFPYKSQQSALLRSTGVTVHSQEMREILLSKFGRSHEFDMHITLLAPADNVFDQIDSRRKKDGGNQFKHQHDIPPTKKVVALGTCGTKNECHLESIASLKNLPCSLKQSIVFLFPLTYGNPSLEHLNTIKQAARSGELDCRFFCERMPIEDLLDLRLATDVAIKVPYYDAFSLGMCEHLYAQNALITGTWLPYSRLESAGIAYRKIETHGDLASCLIHTLENLADLRKTLEQNTVRIRRLLSLDQIAAQWEKIFSPETTAIPSSSVKSHMPAPNSVFDCDRKAS